MGVSGVLHPLCVGGTHRGAVEAGDTALTLGPPAHNIRVGGAEVGVETGLGALIVLAHPADERPVVVRLSVVSPGPGQAEELDIVPGGGVTVTALEPPLLPRVHQVKMLRQGSTNVKLHATFGASLLCRIYLDFLYRRRHLEWAAMIQ